MRTAEWYEGIEVLRGLAALFVVASHAPLMLHEANFLAAFVNLSALAVGVDLLFAISGFLVGTSPRNESGAHVWWIAFTQQVIRRSSRLVLLAWSIAIMTAAIGLLLGADVRAGDFGSAIGFVANFHWAPCFGGDVTTCGDPRFLSHYWALGTEVLLWLAAPLLMLLPRKVMTVCVVAMVVAGLFVHRPWGGALWTFRWEAFAIGLCIGRIIANGGQGPGRLGPMHLIEAAALLLLAAGLVVVIPPGVGQVAIIGVALISGWMVLRAVAGSTPERRAGPAGRGLQWIGGRSYALYLAHPAIYATIGMWLTGLAGAPAGFVGSIAASVAVAHGLTRLAAPMREWGRRMSGGQKRSPPRNCQSPELCRGEGS